MHAAAETRFYGAFMLELKAALQQMVVSAEWGDWTKGASAKVRDEAAAVKRMLLDEEKFWKTLEIMVEVFDPTVKLLRLTDSALPATSKVSACCMQGCSKINMYMHCS